METNQYEQNDPGIDDTLEPGVSADAFQNPVLAKYQTQKYQQQWINNIEASRKEKKKFEERGHKAIDRYADSRDKNNTQSWYNVFFANTEIKLSAWYARTPQPDVSRRFQDADDDLGRVASILLQRNLQYDLDVFGFDAMYRNVLFDRAVPGLGVSWARFEQEGGEEVTQDVTDPITGEVTQQTTTTPITFQKADTDYVAWDDFFWGPCRVWELCPWVARRIAMTKEEVVARFQTTTPKALLEELAYQKPTDNKSENKSLKPKNQTVATIDVYECWDKECGYVFWIVDGAEKPLDVQQDTNDFDNFFPTPMPPLGRFTTSSTIPVSDFSLVQDLYNELDNLNNQAADLVHKLKVRFVYDKNNEALKDLYGSLEAGEGIAVDKWEEFASKGGINGSIAFAPLREIAETYNQLIAARAQVKAQINEIEGISEWFNGQTAHNETQMATAQKSAFGTSRMSMIQHDIAKNCAEILRKRAQMICKFYTPETIVARAGTLSQADSALIPQAIALLKDQHMRGFRLNVSVDSIQLPNWNLEKAEKTEVFKVVMNAVQNIGPVIDAKPEMTPFILNMLKFLVSGYKGANIIEGEIDKAMQQFIEAQTNKTQEPPKPSPAEIEAQAKLKDSENDLERTKLQEQTKLAIAQMKTQIEQMELQIKAQANQIEGSKVAVKAMSTANDQAHNHAYDRATMGNA